MRIDTFKNNENKLLFWEDNDEANIVKEYMVKHNLNGIVISKYLGYRNDSIIFSDEFDFVEEIYIIDSNLKDISFINKFPNLKKLIIQNDDKTEIDLNNFNN